MIARIFRLEMETASPHLNKYDRFCAQRGLTPGDPASFERYLADSAQFAPRRAGDHQSPSHPAADQR